MAKREPLVITGNIQSENTIVRILKETMCLNDAVREYISDDKITYTLKRPTVTQIKDIALKLWVASMAR